MRRILQPAHGRSRTAATPEGPWCFTSRPSPVPPTVACRPGRTSRALAARARIAVHGRPEEDRDDPLHQDSGMIGALVRRYRRMAGLTQEELGEKAGLSVRAVRNLERDEVRRPRRGRLQRLASALGLNDTDAVRLVAAARIIQPLPT